MPSPRVNFGALYWGGKIYVVGGWLNAYTQRCDTYNIGQDRWSDAPELQIEREGISLCVVGDEWLYAFGEVTTRGKKFKLVKNKWQYSVERMALTQAKPEWEVLTITCDAK
jgi:hypothetical protein